ncbi:MAG: hypothetical protein JOZ54_14335 [Acidobacteria bacterium]|nr:hypothetical protein [Acidobacteriota bacterium]
MKKWIVIALLAAACGGKAPETKQTETAAKPATPPPPQAAEAKELIASSPEFGDYKFTDAAVTIPMAKSAMNEPQRKNADALEKAGWVAWDGDKLVVKREDKRLLVRPNGSLDVVPLGKKELLDAKAVSSDQYDISWRWVPNEIGKALQFDETPQHAVATLYWDGAKWGVMSIKSE